MIAQAEPPIIQTQEERIQELRQTVSASRLNCWLGCRLKFYFRYVLRIKRSPTPAKYIGSIVHLVLRYWNLTRWRRLPILTESIQSQFENHWLNEQDEKPVLWEDGEETESKETAWSLLQTYFRDTPIQLDETPEAVEVSVEADLKQHGLPRLIGIIDLVRRGGRIVDFKTTGQTPNQEKAEHLNETQLSCYSLLYREATGKRESGMELHHLVKLKTPKLVVQPLDPMTEGQQTRLFRIIESYQRGLDLQDWIPSPNVMACSGCEYFNECRKWN